MATVQECFDCGTTVPRTAAERNAAYEAGEDPHTWRRCLQCDVALCDTCEPDHECLRSGS